MYSKQLNTSKHSTGTGLGWVAATTEHDYADAQGKGNHVLLLITENSGAMHRDLVKALHELGVHEARL